MNIDDDYLWDRTGEPDPEIQQLEKILGTLRYEARPLEIPAALKVGRERRFSRDFGPRLAIAATIAMLLLGLGVWFGLQRWQRNQSTTVAQTPKTPAESSNPVSATAAKENQSPELTIATPEPEQKRTDGPRRQRVNQSAVAKNSKRLRNEAFKDQLAMDEQKAEAAKNQLMLALRLASAKLNLAQKKTQGATEPDLIHNQHKIG